MSNGNKAINKEKAIALALVDSAPFTTPIKYISIKSYTESPLKPGKRIFLRKTTRLLKTGIFKILDSISSDIYPVDKA